MVYYLGKDIPNELIQLLTGAIKPKILTHAKSAKYVSIYLKCTPDISHIEQMTMIVCFVDVIKPSDNEMSEPKVIIRGHFLGFVVVKETSGAFMSETLLGQLEQMRLTIKNLHD